MLVSSKKSFLPIKKIFIRKWV